MNTKQEDKRLDELWETAVVRFLDKIDWDIAEWLTPEELAEYAKVYKSRNGECPLCGADGVVITCEH